MLWSISRLEWVHLVSMPWKSYLIILLDLWSCYHITSTLFLPLLIPQSTVCNGWHPQGTHNSTVYYLILFAPRTVKSTLCVAPSRWKGGLHTEWLLHANESYWRRSVDFCKEDFRGFMKGLCEILIFGKIIWGMKFLNVKK